MLTCTRVCVRNRLLRIILPSLSLSPNNFSKQKERNEYYGKLFV